MDRAKALIEHNRSLDFNARSQIHHVNKVDIPKQADNASP